MSLALETLELLGFSLDMRLDQSEDKTMEPVTYVPQESTKRFIVRLLEAAREDRKDGPLAQYLVGAKLQVRFPNLKIENFSHSTADQPAHRFGDFRIADTVFHVTVFPTLQLIEKCKRNVEQGLRVYIIVPQAKAEAARQNAEPLGGSVVIGVLEDFVSQNLDQLSGFSASEIRGELRKLLETYNKRVDAIEPDKSLLIEIPRNLT